MSASRRALPTEYERPSDKAFNELIDSGTRGTSGALDVSANARTLGTSGTSGVSGALETAGPRVTSDTNVTPGTSDTKGAAEPRDHVKVRHALAAEMRDAVWFLSEHGRPRVQLGEILDEALTQWLAQAKIEHNGGADFPHKGRLR